MWGVPSRKRRPYGLFWGDLKLCEMRCIGVMPSRTRCLLPHSLHRSFSLDTTPFFEGVGLFVEEKGARRE